MTLDELKKVPLQYTYGMRFDDHTIRQYQNGTIGICKQVVTPYNQKKHLWGKPNVMYTNLKTQKQFKTLEALLKDLNSSSNNS